MRGSRAGIEEDMGMDSDSSRVKWVLSSGNTSVGTLASSMRWYALVCYILPYRLQSLYVLPTVPRGSVSQNESRKSTLSFMDRTIIYCHSCWLLTTGQATGHTGITCLVNSLTNAN